MAKIKSKLVIITGPMFSGKTHTLLGIMREYKHCGFKVIIAKPNTDTRITSYQQTSQNFIYTNDGETHKYIEVARCNSIKELANMDADVIGITESQFFDDIVYVKELLKDKVIICEGLVSDFKGNKFGELSDLMGCAEEIIHNTALCKCGNRAIFTKKLTQSDNIVEIGGKGIYDAVCRECFNFN